VQQSIFQYFNETLDGRIQVAKSAGKYDEGIVSLKASSVSVCPGFPRRIHTDRASGAETAVVKLELDRGVSWDAVQQKWADYKASFTDSGLPVPKEAGFYRTTYQRNCAGTSKSFVIFAYEINTGGGTGRAQARSSPHSLSHSLTLAFALRSAHSASAAQTSAS